MLKWILGWDSVQDSQDDGILNKEQISDRWGYGNMKDYLMVWLIAKYSFMSILIFCVSPLWQNIRKIGVSLVSKVMDGRWSMCLEVLIIEAYFNQRCSSWTGNKATVKLILTLTTEYGDKLKWVNVKMSISLNLLNPTWSHQNAWLHHDSLTPHCVVESRTLLHLRVGTTQTTPM